jgi:hypothetical protein
VKKKRQDQEETRGKAGRPGERESKKYRKRQEGKREVQRQEGKQEDQEETRGKAGRPGERESKKYRKRQEGKREVQR